MSTATARKPKEEVSQYATKIPVGTKEDVLRTLSDEIGERFTEDHEGQEATFYAPKKENPKALAGRVRNKKTGGEDKCIVSLAALAKGGLIIYEGQKAYLIALTGKVTTPADGGKRIPHVA